MSTQPITVEQALDTIDKALATISTNREGHMFLQQCLEAVRVNITNAADVERYFQISEELSAMVEQHKQYIVELESQKASLSAFIFETHQDVTLNSIYEKYPVKEEE